MQTFLPYPSFRESAEALDPKRLGNQFYREGLTLLRGKWRNHPASVMWRGHEHWLAWYCLACADELARRGRFYETHYTECESWADHFYPQPVPPWLGDPDFHSAHRAVLLAKAPEWYSKFNWTEQPAERLPNGRFPYIWPKGVAAWET